MDDSGFGIAVDAAGAAYVTGQTSFHQFPHPAGLSGDFWRRYDDAFVTKLSPAGNTLAYSTYLGGSNDDFGDGIAVDAAGAAYVTGDPVPPISPPSRPIRGPRRRLRRLRH